MIGRLVWGAIVIGLLGTWAGHRQIEWWVTYTALQPVSGVAAAPLMPVADPIVQWASLEAQGWTVTQVMAQTPHTCLYLASKPGAGAVTLVLPC